MTKSRLSSELKQIIFDYIASKSEDDGWVKLVELWKLTQAYGRAQRLAQELYQTGYLERAYMGSEVLYRMREGGKTKRDLEFDLKTLVFKDRMKILNAKLNGVELAKRRLEDEIENARQEYYIYTTSLSGTDEVEL